MNIPFSTLSLTWLPLIIKPHFATCFRWLNVSFVTILDSSKLTHYICGQPLDLVGTHFFNCFLWWEMDYISLCHLGCLHFHHERHEVSCCVNKPLSLCHHLFNLLVNGLTWCYWLMAFAPWSTLSLSIMLEQIWFHVLFHVTRWLE
jgi:hypothetical protein